MIRIAVRSTLALVLAAVVGVLVAAAVSIRWVFPQLVPDEFSLDLAVRTFRSPATRDSLVAGTIVSLSVTATAMSIAWPAARALARSSGRWRVLVFAVMFLPSIVPSVGLAMGINVGLLNLGIDGSMGAVVLAHLVPAVPYAVAILTATLMRYDHRLDLQAATLGATPLQVLRNVTFPQVRAGLIVAAALTFVVSWSQYLLTLLVGSGRVITPTMLLFNATSGGNPVVISTLALLVTAPVIVLVSLASGTPEQETDVGRVSP